MQHIITKIERYNVSFPFTLQELFSEPHYPPPRSLIFLWFLAWKTHKLPAAGRGSTLEIHFSCHNNKVGSGRLGIVLCGKTHRKGQLKAAVLFSDFLVRESHPQRTGRKRKKEGGKKTCCFWSSHF